MADTANNRQFSVMVDDSGVLNYPQNFIAANSLAKFGSDVNGILNSLTTTIINDNPVNDEACSSIVFTEGETSLSNYDRDSYMYSHLDLKTCGFTYETTDNNVTHLIDLANDNFTINVDCMMNVNCASYALNALSASLPANTTIGGAAPATFGNNVVGTLKQLNILNPVEDENNPPLNVMGVNNKFTNITDGGNNIVIIDGRGMYSKSGLRFNNILGGAVMMVDSPSNVDAIIEINNATIYSSSSSVIKISDTAFGDNSGLITVSNTDFSNSGVFNFNSCSNLGPIITVDGEDYLAQFAKKTDVVDLTSEQTITGNKTFTGAVNINSSDDLGIFSARSLTFNSSGSMEFDSGAGIELDSDTISLSSDNVQIGYYESKVNIGSGSLNIVGYENISIENALKIESNGSPIEQEQYASAIKFLKPQQLRIYDTVNKVWTDTYKFVYLAQDENGNVTLAIADEAPINSAVF